MYENPEGAWVNLGAHKDAIAKLEQRNAELVRAVQDLIDHELPIFDRGPTGKRWDKVIAALKQNGGE